MLFTKKTIFRWSLWGEHENRKASIATQAMVSDIVSTI